MGFPQTYAGAASEINVGQHVQPAGAPEPMPLGVNVACRRVLIFADNGDTVYLVTQREQGQAAAACANVGMLIPTVDAAGNVTPLELWINNVSVAWICGAAGGETVYWYAEER